jgi:hypothetical protein
MSAAFYDLRTYREVRSYAAWVAEVRRRWSGLPPGAPVSMTLARSPLELAGMLRLIAPDAGPREARCAAAQTEAACRKFGLVLTGPAPRLLGSTACPTNGSTARAT